ncbi:uncharacterized protein LOC133086786 isoform X2 [Eubalaena glacialis]|uniref:uncharacterized protein LOC133086786 isoform X2 n=1 Tax=Eubalaena glacialis TaxID=27606 RepID=UPI002A59AD29|nr:uncharacterized protein LOC133086786 isoform X2 [Eubalaena glacialis]
MVEGRDAASPKLVNLLVTARSRDTMGDSRHVCLMGHTSPRKETPGPRGGPRRWVWGAAIPLRLGAPQRHSTKQTGYPPHTNLFTAEDGKDIPLFPTRDVGERTGVLCLSLLCSNSQNRGWRFSGTRLIAALRSLPAPHTQSALELPPLCPAHGFGLCISHSQFCFHLSPRRGTAGLL